MINIVIILSSVALATSHDIFVGTNNLGRKIFDENRKATPAIWTRTDNVTINATDSEVISRIIVTDLREEKDGQVKIVDGGEGQKYVTLELQSPAVFRGYDFHIEVYTAPEGEVKAVENKEEEDILHPSQTRIQRTPEESTNNYPHPIFDTKLIVPSTLKPIITDTKINDNKEKKIDSNAESVSEDKPKSDDNSQLNPDLKHSLGKDEVNTSIKPEIDIPFASHPRSVRNSQNKNEREYNEDTITQSDHISHPFVTTKQAPTEASDTKTNSQTNNNFPNRKIAARDTKFEEDLRQREMEAASPRTPSDLAKIVPSINAGNVSEEERKKEEVTPGKNGEENKTPSTNIRSFVPYSESVTEKRQSRDVEKEQNKDINNPNPLVARTDLKKSNEDGKFLPRSNQGTADVQPTEKQNTGIPANYYPLPYSDKSATITSPTVKTQDQLRILEPKSSESKEQDVNVNTPPVVRNRGNLDQNPVIFKQ